MFDLSTVAFVFAFGIIVGDFAAKITNKNEINKALDEYKRLVEVLQDSAKKAEERARK
jgi:tryptophan synthase alpha subunit